mgnify:CR=1 FL=1
MPCKNAYPDDANISTYIRSAKLVGNTITICDDITLNSEGKVVFNYMTCEEPDISTPGELRFNCGRIAKYNRQLKAEIDKIEIKDPKLLSEWPSGRLYRIRLIAENFTSGKFELVIS